MFYVKCVLRRKYEITPAWLCIYESDYVSAQGKAQGAVWSEHTED